MRAFFIILIFVASGCGQSDVSKPNDQKAPLRIVSLDFCADQYVLGLAEENSIAALSTDATANFSYLRDDAEKFPTVRSRTEDILLLQPDMVVRTYGGDADITKTLERAGIDVLQIDFVTSLEDIETTIRKTAQALGNEERGVQLITAMNEKLREAKPSGEMLPAALYLTSKGAAAGRGTIIDQLFIKTGYTNFLNNNGWRSIPLEKLAYNQPEIIATGFFETNDLTSDLWTSARHPVVQRLLTSKPVANIPGALTACNAWFISDAADILAANHSKGL